MSKARATALVIGGGIAGMEAALQLGQGGYAVVLAEKEAALGGNVRKLFSSFPRWEDPQELIKLKAEAVSALSSVTIMTQTEITGLAKNGAGYKADWKNASGETGSLDVNAVIIATGYELMDASVYGEYGYGIWPGVYTSLEFEDVLRGYKEGKLPKPKAVAFIKCVGSRDRAKGNPYCSKICCMYTAKQAGVMKEISPETDCSVFYMDYRATGKEYEEFVRSVIEDRHVRYVRGRPAKVLAQDGRLTVRFEDTLIGVPMETEVDNVVLAAAIVPRPETKALAAMLGVTMDDYGFLEPVYGSPVKLDEGVFTAGACGFAVETLGAAAQGAAAAAEVMALFNKNK